jgi:hypothetical protein
LRRATRAVVKRLCRTIFRAEIGDFKVRACEEPSDPRRPLAHRIHPRPNGSTTMKQAMLNVRRLVFGLAMAAALGFGTTQAAAGTAPDKQPDKARACNPVCKPDCGGFGGELRHWGCLCCG